MSQPYFLFQKLFIWKKVLFIFVQFSLITVGNKININVRKKVIIHTCINKFVLWGASKIF